MSTAVERLAAATDVAELPAIKQDIEAEYQAEKILYDNATAQYNEIRIAANEYRQLASVHEQNMRNLDADQLVGARYVGLLNTPH